METWRTVLRRGLFPLLNDGQLARLAAMLEADDDALVIRAGATAFGNSPWVWKPTDPCRAGCLITVTHERFGDLAHPLTVIEAERHFIQTAQAVDARTAPLARERLIAWFDHTDRETVVRELLAEVRAEQNRRREESCHDGRAASYVRCRVDGGGRGADALGAVGAAAGAGADVPDV